MRTKFGAAAALAVALVLAACGTGTSDGEPEGPSEGALEKGPLTVGIWGGVWEEAIMAVIPGFTEETGAEVVLDVGNSADRVSKLQASQGAGLDIVFLTPEAMIQAEQSDVLSPILVADVPNVDKVAPPLIESFRNSADEYFAVPVSWGAIGLLYREDLVPFEITEITDLWNPALKDRIAVQNMPTLGAASLIMEASQAFGDGPKDIDAGFAALEELKPNIRQYYSVSSDALAALVAGDVWVLETFASQGLPLAEENVKTVLPSKNVTYSLQGVAVASGTERPNLSRQFVDYLLRPDVQATWAEYGHAAPSVLAVDLPEDVQANIAETPATVENLLDIDFGFMADNMQTWTERWQREVAN